MSYQFHQLKKKLKNQFYKRYLKGNQVLCQLCDWEGTNFLKTNCPNCESKARTRLIPFALNYFNTSKKEVALLHVAPNTLEYNYIKSNVSPAVYDRLDLVKRPIVNLQQDLTKTSLSDNSYELILIWHVLEHIPNDTKAILEMYRLLKPGGKALVSVPIYPMNNPTTFEDASIDRKDYQKIHGHHDHCRSCGLDYYKRFEQVGFKTQFLHVKDLEESQVVKFGLSKNHTVWLFEK